MINLKNDDWLKGKLDWNMSETISQLDYTMYFTTDHNDPTTGEIKIMLTPKGVEQFNKILQNHIYKDINNKDKIDYIFRRKLEDFLFSED